MDTAWLVELGWAAGFFDGEGHTRANWTHDSIWQLRVDITQADRRVLDRFQRAVRAGRVYGPYERRTPRHKERFQYSAIGADAQAAIAMIWSALDVVKREQARAALLKVKLTAEHVRVGLKKMCRRGHPFDDANTALYAQGAGKWVSRRCRKCNAEKQARLRAIRRTAAALLEAV